MFRRYLPYATLVLVAIVATTISQSASSYQAYAQEECLRFPETNRAVCGKFLQYWQRNGGLPQQGYPISSEMAEVSDTDGKTYTVQYFERAVFEAHPENQPPHDVLLSLLGAFVYKQRYPSGAPGEQANAEPGTVRFPETGKHLGGLFLRYWREHGGLAQQGYPLTEEFTEVSELNGQSYRVQYFERAVFEYHPENQAAFQVLLSQLGTFRYNKKYVAGQIPTPTAAPVPAITAEYAVQSLKAAGLPIAEVVVYTAETDPNKLLGRPGGYLGKASWHDSRLPAPRNLAQIEVDDGGGVEIFTNTAGAQARADYIQRLAAGSPLFAEYDFVHGPVLLRLSKDLTPQQADEYQRALRTIPVTP